MSKSDSIGHTQPDPVAAGPAGSTRNSQGGRSYVRRHGREVPGHLRSTASQKNHEKEYADGIPDELPKKPQLAPLSITLPLEVRRSLQQLFNSSFPEMTWREDGVRKSRPVPEEQPANLVRNRTSHDLAVVAVKGTFRGADGSESDPKQVPPNHYLVGTMHTHPYRSGVAGAFSIADAVNLVNDKFGVVMIAVSKDIQFLYLRTEKTPRFADKNEVQTRYNQVMQGLKKTHPHSSYLQQTKAQAYALAAEFSFAYYEGKDGVFHREFPAAK